ILLEEVGDVCRAVDFAAETQDPELWEQLVSFVLQPDHSHLLVPLLDQLDNLEARRLAAVGAESQKPQPPPMATPSHVLRLLPGETPLARIASSIQR
ncbi:ZNFX1, partial [Symbiodinium pilosum]